MISTFTGKDFPLLILSKENFILTVFKVGTFSFINRKRYKLVLQAEGGFRARVQFELCGLPTSNYYASALPRSTRRLPLFMELPR